LNTKKAVTSRTRIPKLIVGNDSESMKVEIKYPWIFGLDSRYDGMEIRSVYVRGLVLIVKLSGGMIGVLLSMMQAC